jgi:membrane associated rhomboid family serine protease
MKLRLTGFPRKQTSELQMEALTCRIQARSRLEAMDWSLVLISQAIESTIEHTEESGWGLQISRQDYEAALKTIRLYREENRGRRWRREFLQPGLLFDWVSFAWAILLGAFYWLSVSRLDLRTPGVLDTVALAHGQWWRLFTAMWLHADLAHLTSNAMFGFVLLGLTMGRYGTGVGLMAAYLAGAGGNLFAWIFSSQPHYGLGASGMVMGCLGLLAIQSVSIWRRTPRAGKVFLSALFGGVMLFVLLGLAPGTDVVAHFGGFACGLVLGGLMEPFLRSLRKPGANLICGMVFLALVLWPWWLAMRHET